MRLNVFYQSQFKLSINDMRRTVIIKILAIFARALLAKYKPDVVGVTGSVGKTSTKDAIALVLASHFRVRASQKNFNTEIGVPLSIMGESYPPQSILGWMRVFFHAITLLVFHSKVYPSILVLEMGADKPGDIQYLTALARCTVGVVTAISPVHLEQFGTLEKLANEKRIMYRHLSSDGTAVLNADDAIIFPLKESIDARVITFGLSPAASVRAIDIKRVLQFEEGQERYGGIECTISTVKESCSVSFPLIFRSEHLLCVLAAVAVGFAYHIPLSLMLEWLSHFQPPAGRSRLLPGIKRTLIIDDSYNSSPLAARGAIDALMDWRVSQDAKRIAVLGDMKELGAASKEEHRKLGEYCAQKEVDVLVTVGAEAKYSARAAREYGMETEEVEEFDRAYEAGKYLQEKIKRGDVVLVKGSQDVRLEKVVEEIMAQPERARDLLVRQEARWKMTH